MAYIVNWSTPMSRPKRKIDRFPLIDHANDGSTRVDFVNVSTERLIYMKSIPVDQDQLKY